MGLPCNENRLWTPHYETACIGMNKCIQAVKVSSGSKGSKYTRFCTGNLFIT